MQNLALFIIALLMASILLPIGFVYGVLLAFNRTRYLYKVAYGIDQLGNIIMYPVFNAVLIKNDGYHFGCPDETISSALGKNYQRNTLTKFGIAICKLLNAIDKDHVGKAIEADESSMIQQ